VDNEQSESVHHRWGVSGIGDGVEVVRECVGGDKEIGAVGAQKVGEVLLAQS
jgi:hypothetical protein